MDADTYATDEQFSESHGLWCLVSGRAAASLELAGRQCQILEDERRNKSSFSITRDVLPWIARGASTKKSCEIRSVYSNVSKDQFD